MMPSPEAGTDLRLVESALRRESIERAALGRCGKSTPVRFDTARYQKKSARGSL
jgi:hypothetical protein